MGIRMESKVRIFGHPAHQIAVMFPIGMLAFVGVCDAAGALGKRSTRPKWRSAATSALGAGLVGVAIAAPLGLADYLAVPWGTRAKRVGTLHGIGNAGVGMVFLASWLARKSGAHRAGVALSTLGHVFVGMTAWLGTELVNRLGVGVAEPTSFDAESSVKSSGVLSVESPI